MRNKYRKTEKNIGNPDSRKHIRILRDFSDNIFMQPIDHQLLMEDVLYTMLNYIKQVKHFCNIIIHVKYKRGAASVHVSACQCIHGPCPCKPCHGQHGRATDIFFCPLNTKSD